MIRTKILLTCFAVLVLPGMVFAQSRFFGTLKCQRTNSPPSAGASVKATQTIQTVMEKCAWTLPLQIDADIAQDAQNTFVMQAQGTQSKDTGMQVGRMTNSDQFTLNLSGSSTLGNDGAARGRGGTWTFAGGTGRLKGVIGSGTYTGLATADGGMNYDMEGTYEIPAVSTKDP